MMIYMAALNNGGVINVEIEAPALVTQEAD